MEPLTREEVFLAKMAVEDIETPEALTRKEEYMDKIADKINAAAAELPVVTSADEGKILAVNANGKWDKADKPTELPAVTADDNGDVLTVVEGAWSKAALEKNVVVFPAKLTNQTNKTFTFDNGKTMADINAVVDNGGIAVLKLYSAMGLGDLGLKEFWLFPAYSNKPAGITYRNYRNIGSDIDGHLCVYSASTSSDTPTAKTINLEMSRIALYQEIPTT